MAGMMLADDRRVAAFRFVEPFGRRSQLSREVVGIDTQGDPPNLGVASVSDLNRMLTIR